MRELLVVTHPEASHHVEGRVGGWFDSHLTDRGLVHARLIADELARRVDPGTPVFTSDLLRTRQTAEPIASRLGVEASPLRHLREKSYGEAEGRPQQWFRERFVPPPEHGERMNHDEGFARAETRAEWARRVYAGMDLVLHDPAPQTVVVTHGGTAAFVIAHWIGMPIDALDVVGFRVDPGGITHLREDDRFHIRSVVRLNDTSHLAG